MNQGFTLIEILIVISIISAVGIMIGFFALDISDFGIFLGDTLAAQQELQLTLNVMASEIRSIGPSDNGSYMVFVSSSSSFGFYSDIDGDENFDQVRYFLSGNTLRKGVIAPTGNPAVYDPASEIIIDVIHDVIASATAPIFSYYPNTYNGTGGPLNQPVQAADVRIIKTDIAVDRTPLDKEGRVLFSATTRIRNFQSAP